MKTTQKALLILCAALLFPPQAVADVSVNSTRITANDVLAAGEFYKAAFGMKEVNRLNLPGGAIELFLNFGSTVVAIKAAGGTMATEPLEFGETGIWIGMVNDPAGNVVELLQQP